jgi:hypothetical protein
MARTTPPAVIPPEKHAPKRGALKRVKGALGRAAKKGLEAEAKYGGGITAVTGAVGATAGASFGAGPIGAVVGTGLGEGWRAAYRGAAKKAAAWDEEEALHERLGTLADMSEYVLTQDRAHNDEVFNVYRERRQALRHGRGDALDPWDVPMQELVRGQVVEMEHTDDPLTAIEIAMDHLAEDRHYYTKLATIHEDLHLGPTSRRRLASGVRAVGRVGAALEGATVKGGAFVGGAIGGSLGASAGSAGGPVGTVVGGGVGAAAGGAAGRGLVLAGASFRREAERRALDALEGEYEDPEYGEALRSQAPTAKKGARRPPAARSRTRSPQRPVTLGSHTCLVPEGAVTVRGSSSDKCRAPGTNTPAWQQYVAYAKWVLDRHGVKLDAKPLGCGSYGCAFGLPGRTDVVVKITGDRAEAAALLRVNEAVASEQTSWDRLPALAQASCIYGMLDDCDRPLPIFVITQERLPKRLSKDAGQIVNDYWTQILDVAAGKKDTQNIRGWAEKVLGEDGLAELDALIATVAELSRIGVHWTDLHEGNVMVDAKGHWKIVDLGFSRSPDTVVGALSPTQGPTS